jgi:hypothetical protein
VAEKKHGLDDGLNTIYIYIPCIIEYLINNNIIVNLQPVKAELAE